MADIKDFETEKKKLIDHVKKRPEIETESGILDTISFIPSGHETRKLAEEADEQLKYMNVNYGFINNIGGKALIKCEVYNEYYNRKIVDFITVESLCLRYVNKIADETRGGKRELSLAKWWLGHQFRKEYETVTFDPGMPAGEYYIGSNLYFNTWEGFSIAPKKGSWKKIRKHIWSVLSNKDKHKFRYTIRWFAWAIQNPGDRAQVAMIFKGKKGAGKGVILQAFVKMFGRHGLVVSNKEHLTGKHNEHLAMTSFLFADEGSLVPGDKETEGVLKNIITEPSLTTEPKFRGLKIGKNCLHIAMATNADWVIPATEDERRFYINEVDNEYAKNSCTDFRRDKYFDELWDEISLDGIAAMMYDLLKVNLKGWHPRKDIPRTKELLRQIAMSLPKLKYAFMEMLENGEFPGHMDGEGRYVITNKSLTEYFQSQDSNNKSITGKSVSKLCKDDLKLGTHRMTQGIHYIFPELGELRRIWNNAVSDTMEWRYNETWKVKTTPY